MKHRGIETAVLLLGLASISAGAAPPTTQTGMAACYSKEMTGKKTSSGEEYDLNKLTASSHRIPVGSQVTVTNLANGKSVDLTVNDKMGRSKIIMDMSQEACSQLDFPKDGKAKVKIEVKQSGGG